MHCFAFSGKKKIPLALKRFPRAEFLCNPESAREIPLSSWTLSLKRFFEANSQRFSGQKVCVVIPDNTREFHAKRVLRPLVRSLTPLAREFEFIIALGMHRKLSRKKLTDFLGEPFVRAHRIRQHSLEKIRSLGRVNGVPATLNERIFSYDLLFTVGVVEPHLYAGFSGGIKSLFIGLAGEKTILHTHSVNYLSQKGVGLANVRTNPFQKYLWAASKQIALPIYSLNIVNSPHKKIAGFSIGEARPAFLEAVKTARDVYACKAKKKYDLLLVGCDFPKDQNLYQASRLFNYMGGKRPLIRKGGTIAVFAGLDGGSKSMAEKNFETLLKREALPHHYPFRRPGEHRTHQVIKAARGARLSIITPNAPKGRFPSISFFPDTRAVLTWAARQYGDDLRIGVIPSGFSFIPSN
jgi:nickel-dependent lactate racemase